VELGPGVLGNIFDGIQRPLKAIAIQSGDVFIPRGVACPSLDIVKQWEFQPKGFKVHSLTAAMGDQAKRSNRPLLAARAAACTQ
jgi:vacuolar-type H+-ATPase catalytic subunit A/Vma1